MDEDRWRNGRRWVRRHDALWRVSHDRVLVVVPGQEDTVSVTGPGVAAWHLLDIPRSGWELTECLAEVYETPPEGIADDVRHLLEQLERLDLIVPVV